MAWKAWRAGKASQMAQQGSGLGEVLTAGEWRSKALLNYVNESAIDAARILDDTLAASDAEDV